MKKYKLIYPESYIWRAKNFFRKHPELLPQYQKVLELMEINPFHPSLRLHPLKGKLRGLHSVSINISYRLTIEFIIEDQGIILIDIGSHDEIY